MKKRTIHLVTVSTPLILTACICFCKANAAPPKAVADPLVEFALHSPIAFGLDAPNRRPKEYPEQILLTAVEKCIRKKKVLGQGCGAMQWEGKLCGMFNNDYEPMKTPWLKEPTSLDCTYAQTDSGTFLAAVTLGENLYERPDRSSKVLHWKRNHEPKKCYGKVYRTLHKGTSNERMQILREINYWNLGVDMNAFRKDRRASVATLIEVCLADPDVDVVKLAKKIAVDLRSEVQ